LQFIHLYIHIDMNVDIYTCIYRYVFVILYRRAQKATATHLDRHRGRLHLPHRMLCPQLVAVVRARVRAHSQFSSQSESLAFQWLCSSFCLWRRGELGRSMQVQNHTPATSNVREHEGAVYKKRWGWFDQDRQTGRQTDRWTDIDSRDR
jgi:hypothetical protein